MDKLKIFKEYLSRVAESANKQNDIHKQQLIKSYNKVLQMFEEQQKEIDELEEEIESLENQINYLYETILEE